MAQANTKDSIDLHDDLMTALLRIEGILNVNINLMIHDAEESGERGKQEWSLIHTLETAEEMAGSAQATLKEINRRNLDGFVASEMTKSGGRGLRIVE